MDATATTERTRMSASIGEQIESLSTLCIRAYGTDGENILLFTAQRIPCLQYLMAYR